MSKIFYQGRAYGDIQYSNMPQPGADNLGKIVQYTGATNSNYIQGDYYISTHEGSNYFWKKITYNKTEIDQIVSVGISFIFVDNLPISGIKTDAIYLIPKITTIIGYTSGTNQPVYIPTGTDLSPSYDIYTYNNSLQHYQFSKVASTTESQNVLNNIGTTYSETTIQAEARNNAMAEYINLNGTTTGWEIIGDTEVNLEQYVKQDDLNEITLEQINAAWTEAGY